MIPRLFLTCLGLVALFTSGCLFSKKASKEKENPSIAGATEDSLRTRFIEKRAAELVASGKTAEAARAQATQEFTERYGFTGEGKKK